MLGLSSLEIYSFVLLFKSGEPSMDKLIDIARKMEEQEATPSKIAKTIVHSYKVMDKQRDELKGIHDRKDYRQQPSIPFARTVLNNTNSSMSKQSSEKGKVRKMEASSTQKPSIIHQQPPGKLILPSSSRREVPKQSVNSSKPISVGLKFKDQDKEFQIFSLKLLFQKVNKLRLLVGRFHSKSAMITLKKYYKNLMEKEDNFILKRAKRLMAKYFHLLSKQTLIIKLERQNQTAKRQFQKQKLQEQKANDYHEYLLYQKAMRSWKRYLRLVYNQKKKVEQDTQLARNPEPVQPVSHLKSKMLDFLQNIKQDIEQQNRPPPPVVPQVIEQQQIEASQSQSHLQIESYPHSDEQQIPRIISVQAHVEHPEVQHIPGRKLTHEELLKRRDELQKKNKQRKERLERIKKEKQQQKVKLEEERRLSELKLKEQQTKRKQQEYQKFIKRKQDEQLAKQREKQDLIRIQKLHEFAEQQDKMRLIKYFGMLHWKKLIADRNTKFKKLAEKVQKGLLKLYWIKFLDRYDQYNQELRSKQILQEKKATKLYKSKCRVRVLKVLKAYMEVAAEQKLELESRHCINLCKITLKAWWGVMDQIRLQNYETERIQIQKTQTFRNAYLLRACFKALARNKQSQKRDRNINQHKNNLKNKLSQWVKEQSEINIDKLLQ